MILPESLDLNPMLPELAKKYCGARELLYIGRNTDYSVSLEGALEDEGNLLHSCRILCGRRTETRNPFFLLQPRSYLCSSLPAMRQRKKAAI